MSASADASLTIRLNEELAAVRTELTRLDGKSSTLTTLAGAALAFVVAHTAGHAPIAVKVPMVIAGIAVACAAVLLLATVLRPRLGPTGFNRYSTMTSAQICALLKTGTGADADRAKDLEILSRFARVKNLRYRLALDLTVTGVALIALAMAIGLLTT